MTTKASMGRIRWAVDTLAPNPDDLLLEIGCGPGDAVSLICERLTRGRVVAIDRSATAVGRAATRNAANVAVGKAVLQTVALEELRPADVLQDDERFDKILAMNVNLFWTREPAKELALIRELLTPVGPLYLFYGYGGYSPAAVPSKLLAYLTAGGFAVQTTSGPGVACAVAAPEQVLSRYAGRSTDAKAVAVVVAFDDPRADKPRSLWTTRPRASRELLG